MPDHITEHRNKCMYVLDKRTHALAETCRDVEQSAFLNEIKDKKRN